MSTLMPRRSELVYPSLLDGLLARYCPSVTGPTGFSSPDLSGRGRGITGATSSGWALSEGHYAYDFTGVANQYQEIPSSVLSPLDTIQAFTYSGWFYNAGNFTSYQTLVDTDALTRRLGIFFGGDANHLYLAFRNAIGQPHLLPFTLQLNTWYHLAVTTDPSGFVQPWVNGIAGEQRFGAGFGWSNPTIRLGTNPSGGGANFIGKQDDIALYGRVLTNSEIGILASERGAAYKTRKTFARSVGVNLTKTSTDTLNIADVANFTVLSNPLFPSATSTLTINDAATFFLLSDVFQAADTLNIVDSVEVFGRPVNGDVLTIDSIATFRIGPPVGGYFITDVLNIVDSLSRGQNYGVTDALNIVDNADRVTPSGDVLSITQSVSVGKGYNVHTVLDIVQTVDGGSLFIRHVGHTDIVQQAVAYYIIGADGCAKSEYARFEGSGPDDGIPSQPRAGNHIQVSVESLTGTPAPVLLRAPEMDDKNRLSFDRVNRETSGGELNVYRDPDWSQTQSLLFTIVGLKTAIFTALQSFMFATLGQEILFNDWTGVTWRGIITNPDEAATEDADGFWTIAIEFEGEPYEGPPATHNLNITQTVSFTIA